MKYQNVLVRLPLLNYEDMFVITPIYIRYVVISIVIFTSMLDIESFYLIKFVHLLDVSLSNYLSLYLTLLWCVIDKV